MHDSHVLCAGMEGYWAIPFNEIDPMVGFLSFHIMAVEVAHFLDFRPLTIEVEKD